MIDEQELLALLRDPESSRVERTVSTKDTGKFSEAVCAFANDLSGSRQSGFLLIGVEDTACSGAGLQVTDELLQNLAGLATDGNILPPPALQAYRIPLSDGSGEVAVVEVQPSNLTPVRYRGRTWIRRGPRKGIANEAEETILIERRTAMARTFDAQPCAGASLQDLAVDLFTNTYRPEAVDAEVIAENHRPVEHQLASLRFFDLARNAPTYAGILLFAKDVLHWLPNGYVQYVRFEGEEQSSDVVSEKSFQGDLLTVARDLSSFIGLITERRPERRGPLEERMVSDYPEVAIREFVMNAILHRSYELPAPVRFYQYSNRIEIQNPGPLYGIANPENFPAQTSYRNPILAEALKTLGLVNRFGRGVIRAQDALERNGGRPAEFTFGEAYFGVTIWVRK